MSCSHFSSSSLGSVGDANPRLNTDDDDDRYGDLLSEGGMGMFKVDDKRREFLRDRVFNGGGGGGGI